MYKFFKKLFFYSLSLIMFFYAIVLGKEWLVPWYLDIFGMQAPWENMYKDNGNILINPVYDKYNIYK